MVVFQNDTFLTYIFEIIYSVVHLLIVIYALILSIKAYREGSWVMKTLMYTRMNESVKSNMAAIISMLTAIFSFLIFVYSTLMLFNVVPGLSSFPLKLDLVNVAISVFTVALYFNLYPRIVDKNKGGN